MQHYLFFACHLSAVWSAVSQRSCNCQIARDVSYYLVTFYIHAKIRPFFGHYFGESLRKYMAVKYSFVFTSCPWFVIEPVAVTLLPVLSLGRLMHSWKFGHINHQGCSINEILLYCRVTGLYFNICIKHLLPTQSFSYLWNVVLDQKKKRLILLWQYELSSSSQYELHAAREQHFNKHMSHWMSVKVDLEKLQNISFSSLVPIQLVTPWAAT